MTQKLRVPDRRQLPAAWIELRRQHLLDELAARPRAERRRRRIVVALVPAVLVLLAATAFTTYKLTRNPTHLESVGCYDRASLSANTAVVGADGRDPVAICAEVWQEGALGRPVPKHLEACVLQTGAIGVFPGTCSSLGLAPLPASYRAQAMRFASLQNAIVAGLGTLASGSSKRGRQCVGRTPAERFVRRILDARGYGDWQIKVAGGAFTATAPCAEPSFDTGGKSVYLIPAAR
ncbi:MAG TPA: hypothetical protein VKB73_04850 [Gaiellaceae bacterium]|nr:hypothetical protein [Gaiellaceae bacterium]